jgi:hypothetical protein
MKIILLMMLFISFAHGSEPMNNNDDYANKQVQYHKRMDDISKKFIKLGWATGYKYDRQDAWFEWTDKGKSKFKTFISEMQSNIDVFTKDDIEFIGDGIFYYGIKERGKEEVLYESLKDIFKLIGQEDIIIRSGNESMVFERKDLFRAVCWILQNNKDEILVFKNPIRNSGQDWLMKIPPNAYK